MVVSAAFHMVGRPEVHRVAAGQLLPATDNPSTEDTAKVLYAAVRRAGAAVNVVQSRHQLLVFEARVDQEDAEDWAEEAWAEMRGMSATILDIKRFKAKSKLLEELNDALSRTSSVTADIYETKGARPRA